MAAESPTPPPDKLERQKALLAKLEGRLFRASQLPARPAPPPPAPVETVRNVPLQLDAGDPGSPLALERVENEAGLLSRLMLPVELDGQPTARGIRFPVALAEEPLSMPALALLAQDESLGEVPLERVAFVDCETTGLAGGTGTFAFLVGIGWFCDGRFVVEQYFMEDYDEEAALVEALCERLRAFDAFVSYNGKAYDLPLLQTRFIFHRRRMQIDKPHLDLLHPSRRIWRGRLPDCSLGSVERGVLNLRRRSDIDGFLIPQIYFDYVLDRRREAMTRVFDHHAQDIVSLAALAGRMSRLVESPLDESRVEAEDQVRLAGLFQQCVQMERSIACLQSAVLRLRDPLMIFTVSMHLARSYKRCGRWEEACAIWQAQIDGGPGGRLEPYVELAKYYEHRERDVAKAHQIVQRAMQSLDARSELRHYLSRTVEADVTGEELLHRLGRLRKRLRRRDDRDGSDG